MRKRKLSKAESTKTKADKKNLKQRKKVEKGESAILRPIKFITTLAIILAIANLALPTIHDTLGFKSIWNWILCCVYFYAVLNSRGLMLEYNIPIGWVLGVRTVEFLIHKIPTFDEINLLIFFILCVLDALFLGVLYFHKNNYEFEVEKYDK